MKNSLSATANAVDRDQLVAQHIGLVHHIGRKLFRSLSTEWDLDELVSSGTIGLMKAIPLFDSGRGVAFSTYAAPRIRGAILDELRRQDHVSRSVRRKNRKLVGARNFLTRSLEREPENHELAKYLGIDLKTLWQWQTDAASMVRVSLDRPKVNVESGQGCPMEELVDSDQRSMEDLINQEEEVAYMKAAIMELKEQERWVLSLYYFEELKLHEIATVLGVTESRVSQIRTRAITKLQGMLGSLRQESIAARVWSAQGFNAYGSRSRPSATPTL